MSEFVLTDANYHSVESNKRYLSVSQYKDFVGTAGFPKCESKALAKMRGEWVEEPSIAMLSGSLLDAMYEGTMDKFKQNTPQLFTMKGELRSEFKKVEEIFEFGKKDEMFSTYMAGEKQIIFTGEMFSGLWKIKIDALHRGKCVVDLKLVKSLYDRVWSNGAYLNFIQSYGYVLQGAVYQRIVKINTGEELPFFLACLTKEDQPDKAIVQIPDIEMELELSQVRLNVEHILRLKNGDEPAVRCERCAYCRSTKKITEVTSFYDII
jgi:hypothetical protein